jgi:hypothetical protein
VGVDLTLLVVTGTRDFGFAHTLLQLKRRRDLWPAVEALESQPAPTKFSTYFARVPDGSMEGESCYGYVTETPYGTPLRMVQASALVTLAGHVDVNDNPTNRATWAYLAALPGETWIALWWN